MLTDVEAAAARALLREYDEAHTPARRPTLRLHLDPATLAALHARATADTLSPGALAHHLVQEGLARRAFADAHPLAVLDHAVALLAGVRATFARTGV